MSEHDGNTDHDDHEQMGKRGVTRPAMDMDDGKMTVEARRGMRDEHHRQTEWAACFVGAWMNAAPLVFWSPSAACYLNDTIVGALVIALTILIPGMLR